ncbi:RND transporter [Pandoraea captiosa]|uniref:RND transporter n=1 Tax=Pandoraea captiosa TaxID=2508302 RepID=A0A5E4ZW88_9BURK|nr:TolC family protein [Pandoraea captiosa]VVE64220.1 RND transporter [Pandoraea captiosa]
MRHATSFPSTLRIATGTPSHVAPSHVASLGRRPSRRTPFVLASLTALATLALSGCATFSDDGGFSPVAQATQKRLGASAVWARDDATAQALADARDDLLKRPLDIDAAVRVTLLNHRGLQATYAELGIAEASLVQAGRLPNPRFSFQRVQGGGDVSIERTWGIDFVRVLTMPLAARIEARRFAQVQAQVTQAIVEQATLTRRAWIDAVAAQERVAILEQTRLATQAASELADGMTRAGNFSAMRRTQANLVYADTAARLARAREQANSAREHLARQMGLWGQQLEFTLPSRLPDLPRTRPAWPDAQAQALRERADVRAARAALDATASDLGLTRVTRIVNVLDTAYRNNSETGKPSEHGYEISLEVPLFDRGSARVAGAEARYRQSVDRLADTAVAARADVRTRRAQALAAWDIAEHYRTTILPMRQRVSDEWLLRYNGMLASVFDLLTDAREQRDTILGDIDARADYWLADTAFRESVGGAEPDEADTPPGANAQARGTPSASGSVATGVATPTPTSSQPSPPTQPSQSHRHGGDA